MSFDISEMLEQLESIKNFANKVSETKKLADELAGNLTKMKMNINETINQSFGEIANQIDQLRKNMEQMESVKPSTPPTGETTPAADALEEKIAEPEPVPEPEPAPEPEPTPPPEPEPEPEPEPVEAEPEVVKPEPEPEPVAPEPEEKPEVKEEPPETEEAIEAPSEEGDDQLDFLLQQKDRLKASLTDLRFDYMRGYIPEEEYKSKEAELDTQLEDLDNQIAELR